MLLFFAFKIFINLSSWVNVFFFNLSSYICERLSSIFFTSATFKLTIVYTYALKFRLFGLIDKKRITGAYPKVTLSWWVVMHINGWVGTKIRKLNYSCFWQRIGSISKDFREILSREAGHRRLYSFKKLLNSYFLI